MSQSRPVILIGPISSDPAESVSAVNRNFIRGLGDRYEFVECRADRSHGTTRQSRLSLWNFYYLLRQGIGWIWRIVQWQPAIAHYAISSGWAFEKSMTFLWLAKLCGVRTIGHLHSGGFIDHWKNLNSVRRQVANWAVDQVDLVVVLSEGWKRLLMDQVPLAGEKIFVVNNPIDQTFEETALAWPVARSPGKFISLGIMSRDKGVLDLIEASVLLRDQHQDFSLQLAGPEREPQIRRLVLEQIAAQSLQRLISVQSGVWGAEKLELFRDSSLFVLPSYYENFPLVLLEAAAAGQAIITTPVGAVAEFFSDGESAVFIESGNPQQLAGAMRRLLEKPEERNRLGENARAVFVERLARSRIMESLDEVYRRGLPSPLSRREFSRAEKRKCLQSIPDCD